MFRTLSLLFCSFILLSCGSQPIKPEATKQITVKEKKVQIDHPLWIDDPRLVNHIGVTGSADLQAFRSRELQYWNAMENAQTNMNIAYKKYQRTLMLNKKNLILLTHESKLELPDKELLFHNAIVHDEWIDPVTGKLYLWLTLPLDHTNDQNNQE